MARYTGFEIKFDVPEPAGLRDERGRFVALDSTEGQSELYRRNKLIAETVQGNVARRISNRVMFGKRAKASTGLLVRATVDPRNTRVDPFNVGVGNPEWLDRSMARYWRTFEYGSAAVWKRPFIGTRLRPIGRFVAPDGTFRYSKHGQRSPSGVRTWKSGRIAKGWVVKQEIAPAHIYRDVANEADLGTEGLAAARAFIHRNLTRDFPL